MPFVPQNANPGPLCCDNVAEAALEARGVQFLRDTFDTRVCHMASFAHLDGHEPRFHDRHAPTSRRARSRRAVPLTVARRCPDHRVVTPTTATPTCSGPPDRPRGRTYGSVAARGIAEGLRTRMAGPAPPRRVKAELSVTALRASIDVGVGLRNPIAGSTGELLPAPPRLG